MTKKQEFTVKKERRLKATFNIPLFKILGYICLIIIIWYVFIEKEYIHLYLLKTQSKNISIFYTILVSMTFLMFLVSTGVKISYGKKITILIVFIIVILLVMGFQDFGLGIQFRENFHLLNHNRYESNTIEGIKFMYRNLIFWIIVWIICLALIGDDD